MILYNYTDLPQIAAEEYIETVHKQSVILHQLGLSTTQTDAQRMFASNIVAQGLFSFLVGEIPSIYQLWVFAVCIAVTSAVVIKIVSCCCLKPCIKRNKDRYQQFAVRVEQSAIGRFSSKKNQTDQEERDIELQHQAIQMDYIPEPCPPYCTGIQSVSEYRPMYPSLSAVPVKVQEQLEKPDQIKIQQEKPYFPAYMAGIDTDKQPLRQTCLPIKIGLAESIALWDTGSELRIISEQMCRALNKG